MKEPSAARRAGTTRQKIAKITSRDQRNVYSGYKYVVNNSLVVPKLVRHKS